MDPKSISDHDCVRMKHDAQKRLLDATPGMSAQERDAYVNKRAEENAKAMHWTLESIVTPEGVVEIREVPKNCRD